MTSSMSVLAGHLKHLSTDSNTDKAQTSATPIICLRPIYCYGMMVQKWASILIKMQYFKYLNSTIKYNYNNNNQTVCDRYERAGVFKPSLAYPPVLVKNVQEPHLVHGI